jgi:hypothetical protein
MPATPGAARSHQGRTRMQNATRRGYQRHVETRGSTPNTAWIDPLLTFMVKEGSPVRVPEEGLALRSSTRSLASPDVS